MNSSIVNDVTTTAPNAAETGDAFHGGDPRWTQHRVVASLVGVVVSFLGTDMSRTRRDDRGLSQSTENAILLAGAAAIAMTIIAVITAYVKQRLPK